MSQSSQSNAGDSRSYEVSSTVAVWINLLHLARRRFRSDEDYHRFQNYQARLIIDYLTRNGVNFSNARVLDLGCGKGGYSRSMTNAEASVISLDLARPVTDRLPETFCVGDAMRLPFAPES